jgi:hypothetical protein
MSTISFSTGPFDDNRYVKELAKRSMSNQVLLEHRGIPIASQLKKANLVVNDEKSL